MLVYSSLAKTASFPRCYGKEYCGRPVDHPFELYLAIQKIQHRRTDIGSSETNGFCERFHRTVREGFYAVAFRKTFYESLEHLQRDLDEYLAFYNPERAHQGHRTQGRTQFQFKPGQKGLPKCVERR